MTAGPALLFGIAFAVSLYGLADALALGWRAFSTPFKHPKTVDRDRG